MAGVNEFFVFVTIQLFTDLWLTTPANLWSAMPRLACSNRRPQRRGLCFGIRLLVPQHVRIEWSYPSTTPAITGSITPNSPIVLPIAVAIAAPRLARVARLGRVPGWQAGWRHYRLKRSCPCQRFGGVNPKHVLTDQSNNWPCMVFQVGVGGWLSMTIFSRLSCLLLHLPPVAFTYCPQAKGRPIHSPLNPDSSGTKSNGEIYRPSIRETECRSIEEKLSADDEIYRLGVCR